MNNTPTPQSDQAATTPGRAEELAAWLEREIPSKIDGYYQSMRDAATLLRSQSAELLALRADRQRLDWLADRDNCIGNVQIPKACVLDHLDSMRAAIDAAMALNSPTQKSPAK